MVALQRGLETAQLSLVFLVYVVAVRALEKEGLDATKVVLVLALVVDAEQVVNLVEVLLRQDHPQHALGVPEHVEAALAASLLLRHWYMAHLTGEDVWKRPNLQVLQALANLGAVHQLELLADGRLAIKGVHLVVVALHDAVVVGHAHIRYQVQDDV